MPLADDKLRFTIVSELSGVAFRNDMYWDVGNPGTNLTLAQIAALLGDEWIRVSNQVLVTELTYVAFILDNLTRNEVRGVVTSDINGLDASGSHPQDQVVRFNEYGHNDSAEPLRRGAFNLSGVGQQFSKDGRVNDFTEFNQIRLFLSIAFFDSPSQFSATPNIRTRVPLSNPATYLFHTMTNAVMSTRLFKLKSRKVSLLGV